MKPSFSRILPISLLLGLLLSQASVLAQGASKTASPKVNAPPSADLRYAIKANQKGLSLDGTALVRWRNDSQRYSVATETHASLLGKILEAKSEGAIERDGLAPATATEKRFRRGQTTTTFDRAARTIRFSASDASYPIRGGEQDRNSAIWQLVSLARANQLKAGSTVSFVVAGQKDADPWSFKVGRQQTIATPLGKLKAQPISKVVKNAGKDQKVEIWLASAKEWYPVRLRFTEPNGDFIEQALEKISPAS